MNSGGASLPPFRLSASGLFFAVLFGHRLRDHLRDVPEQSDRTTFVRVFAVLASSIPEFFLLSLLIIIPSYLWNYSQPVGGYLPFFEDPCDTSTHASASLHHRHRWIGGPDAPHAHDNAGSTAERLRAHGARPRACASTPSSFRTP